MNTAPVTPQSAETPRPDVQASEPAARDGGNSTDDAIIAGARRLIDGVKPLPDPDTLRRLLSYNPDTGSLVWNERTSLDFPSAKFPHQACAAWNAKYAHKPAFVQMLRGYLIGTLFERHYTAHRIAYAIHFGRCPTMHIDHINGNRSDNRIHNLRQVTRAENNKNVKLHSTNSSGVCGVAWHKAAAKWVAKIGVKDQSVHLGLFESFEDAVAARKAAEARYGFHPNHGRAA